MATFIAGNPSGARDKDDPLVTSAVEDALDFYKNLPDKNKPSMVNAGTTADPSTILSMTWISSAGKGARTSYIGFKGGEKVELALKSESGEAMNIPETNKSVLQTIDVPKFL